MLDKRINIDEIQIDTILSQVWYTYNIQVTYKDNTVKNIKLDTGDLQFYVKNLFGKDNKEKEEFIKNNNLYTWIKRNINMEIYELNKALKYIVAECNFDDFILKNSFYNSGFSDITYFDAEHLLRRIEIPRVKDKYREIKILGIDDLEIKKINSSLTIDNERYEYENGKITKL